MRCDANAWKKKSLSWLDQTPEVSYQNEVKHILDRRDHNIYLVQSTLRTIQNDVVYPKVPAIVAYSNLSIPTRFPRTTFPDHPADSDEYR